MSPSAAQERSVDYDGQSYTLLYENTIGTYTWTTAYRLDKTQHVHLLHRVQNSETGEDAGKTLYLHYNDVKMIYLKLLLDEMRDSG